MVAILLDVEITAGKGVRWYLGVLTAFSGVGSLAQYPVYLFFRWRGAAVDVGDWAAHGAMIGGWSAALFLFVYGIVGTL